MLPQLLSDPATTLALGGVLVSILAALYANRSAVAAQRQAKSAELSAAAALEQLQIAQRALDEAKRQSSVAARAHQLGVYEALIQYQREQIGMDVVTPKDLGRLWDILRNADFYFSAVVEKAVFEVMYQGKSVSNAQERVTYDSSQMPNWSYEVSEESILIAKQFRAALESCLSFMRAEIKSGEG